MEISRILPKAQAKVGFATYCSPRHIRAYYHRLIEYLAQELGSDFEVASCEGDADVLALDGRYRILIFASRYPAQFVVDRCEFTKSLLVDHGPLHSNRTERYRAHFEVFPSPYLMDFYSESGLAPVIKGWSGGYFLTDHLDSLSPRRKECMVYLIHMRGWRANSLTELPFTDEESISYLTGLAKIFDTVHVVSHLNGGGNFVARYRDRLPGNVLVATHGPQFFNLVNNVGAIFFDYSSVFSIGLWDPEVRLFQRVPQHPCGPVMLHAVPFHRLMETACYSIRNDDLSEVPRLLREDPLRQEREKAKRSVYDETVSDPYGQLLSSVREALELVGDPLPKGDEQGDGLLKLQV